MTVDRVIIPCQHRRTALEAHAPPAARVSSGAIVEFQTSDEPYELLARGIPLEALSLERFNQVTGPLAIIGARPGQVLRIDILDIIIERAWLVSLRGFGPLGHLLEESRCEAVTLLDGTLTISERLRIPVQPSIGCIGLAPARGVSSTFRPVWPWGGNLDLVELGPGSTIWLPVQRPEAYLYIGDVHAAIGAGEPAHVGIEAAARVIVRTTVDPEVRCRAPRIRTGHTLLLVGVGPTFSAAQQHALQQAMEVLRTEFALTQREAYAYACACLSYRFGGPAGPVVLAELPLQPLSYSSGMRTPS